MTYNQGIGLSYSWQANSALESWIKKDFNHANISSYLFTKLELTNEGMEKEYL